VVSFHYYSTILGARQRLHRSKYHPEEVGESVGPSGRECEGELPVQVWDYGLEAVRVFAEEPTQRRQRPRQAAAMANGKLAQGKPSHKARVLMISGAVELALALELAVEEAGQPWVDKVQELQRFDVVLAPVLPIAVEKQGG